MLPSLAFVLAHGHRVDELGRVAGRMNLADRDRPLNKRGERDAPEMVRRLVRLFMLPERMVTRSACCVLTTAKAMTAWMGMGVSNGTCVLPHRPHTLMMSMPQVIRIEAVTRTNTPRSLKITNAATTPRTTLNWRQATT